LFNKDDFIITSIYKMQQPKK